MATIRISLASGVSSTGALAVLPSSPYNNGVAATSITVNPANSVLYAGTTNGIYAYLINSNGSLTVQNTGTPTAQDICADGHAGRQYG